MTVAASNAGLASRQLLIVRRESTQEDGDGPLAGTVFVLERNGVNMWVDRIRDDNNVAPTAAAVAVDSTGYTGPAAGIATAQDLADVVDTLSAGSGVVGGHDTGPLLSNSFAETSLLNAPIELPAIAAGETIEVDFAYRFLNNSGAVRAPTFRLKVGATTLATVVPAGLGSNALDRHGVARAVIRSNGDDAQTVWMRCEHYVSSGSDTGAQGASVGGGTEAMQTAGLELNITGQLVTAVATLQVQITAVSVRKTSNAT